MWCIPKVDAEFVARMEDVLELYAEAPHEQHPVVCFDETRATRNLSLLGRSTRCLAA
jgi:hypothetical protein